MRSVTSPACTSTRRSRLGFTLKRLFPPRWVPTYVIAQLIGATAAGLALVFLFGHDAATHAVTEPHGIDQWVALSLEIFLTWVLLSVILDMADRAHLVGPNAALAVGATIIACGLIALPLEGSSMNPARSTGPALATGTFGDLWIYWLGPLIGAVIAVGFMSFVHGEKHDQDKAQEEQRLPRASAASRPAGLGPSDRGGSTSYPSTRKPRSRILATCFGWSRRRSSSLRASAHALARKSTCSAAARNAGTRPSHASQA